MKLQHKAVCLKTYSTAFWNYIMNIFLAVWH